MTEHGILQIEPIAEIRTDFREKFGLPRQSGLVPELRGEIVFRPSYSQPEAVRGIEAFSHLWLIWGFHAAEKPAGKGWSATVRPPRLGGNVRMGVYATRSPFRPNPLGLSCVKLEAVHAGAQPLRLTVSGIDLLDGTPIYDIKPYIPLADCKPEAAEGYTAATKQHCLEVNFPAKLLELLPPDKRTAAAELLRQDPRPGYADDPERIYGISFAGFDIRFTVSGEALTVCEVLSLKERSKQKNGKTV
jgi:tRNA-Thr(GGU) m(6)t(6)A37 methyltransferase TsaA